MRTTPGACRDPRRAGMAGLAVLLVLLIAGSATILLLPNLTVRATEKWRADEDLRLRELDGLLVNGIKNTGTIPSATNWARFVAASAGMNLTNVEQVYPSFPADGSTRRVLLIDPALGATALPYVQTTAGLTGVFTNLATDAGRLMLISNTRRGLTLPVTNGPATSATVFNNLWNWANNPATKAPPSGWPATWTGRGDELHVERINLRELFHMASLNNVLYSVETNAVVNTPTRLNLTLLNSTLLTVYETNGTLIGVQRLTKNYQVDRTTTNTGPPVVHFKFSELAGSIATNSGSYGSVWNGVYTNSVLPGQTTPRPPTFPGFASNNYSAYFDGYRSYVETSRRYTNYLPSFTFAVWIAPETFKTYTIYVAGIRSVININLVQGSSGRSNYVRISTRFGSLSTHYPYALGQWRHFAATASGTQLRSYIDGEFKRSYSKATVNYSYSNIYTFRIGANPAMKSSGALTWNSYAHFKGGIDDVVFYDRVISTNEIKSLARGVIP